MKAFLWGFVIGLITIPLAVLAYFASGRAPVSTAGGALPFERALASGALHARMEREMPKSVPIPADEATYLAGAPLYQKHCSVCHGLPGGEMTSIAKGMFPKPPQLFRGKGVTDDPPGETYWKVSNGIRLTGMPGFKASLSESEMWEVSLLLANADKLSDSVKQTLAAPAPAPPATAIPSLPAPPAPATPQPPAAEPAPAK
ncbi:MAG TPA: cytochrome c [Terriglobales bacterium]|nr:cytochrome c [Terriglobales bacterium]